MKSTARSWLVLLAFVLTVNSRFATLHAQGTAFTYQGQLQNNGSPASGTYNLQFLLYTNETGSAAIAGPVTTNGLILADGLFTVTLDFGADAWTGATNWLEIAVETNGLTHFTTLTPRQQVTPIPFAITAQNVTGILAGNGSGLTNVNAATLGGLSASNYLQASNGGAGMLAPGATGFNNIFTNVSLVTLSNGSAGVVITNDESYLMNNFQDVDLEFYGISDTNFGQILFAGPAGLYANITENSAHDGSPASPYRSELILESANNIALIPNNPGDGVSGHLQIGGLGVPSYAYMNTAYDPALVSVTPSQPLLFRSSSEVNGTVSEFDPGFCADWPIQKRWEGHFYIFHDTGLYGTVTTMPDKDVEIRGADFYIGTNSSGKLYTGVELFGRSNGAVTTTLQVDTNGITLTGNVTARHGTFSAGPAFLPTNTAPLTIVSNFSPSAAALYTNLLPARIEVAGSISCQAGGNLGGIESAIALINYTNNGIGAAPLEIGSTAIGAATNIVVSPFRFDLGPGGTFNIVTQIVGQASAVGFPQNVTFTIE